MRGTVQSPAEEEPGPSRRYAGVTKAKKGWGEGEQEAPDAGLLSVSIQRCGRGGKGNKERFDVCCCPCS